MGEEVDSPAGHSDRRGFPEFSPGLPGGSLKTPNSEKFPGTNSFSTGIIVYLNTWHSMFNQNFGELAAIKLFFRFGYLGRNEIRGKKKSEPELSPPAPDPLSEKEGTDGPLPGSVRSYVQIVGREWKKRSRDERIFPRTPPGNTGNIKRDV